MTAAFRVNPRIAGVLLLTTVAFAYLLLQTTRPARGTAAAPDCPTGPDCSGAGAADARQSNAEQQLAEKYAPILQLKEQAAPCDTDGEAYLPSPVEIVFDNPRVTLVLPVQGAQPSLAALTAEDLVEHRNNRDAYLDFPGTPGNPGCTYERDFQAFSAGVPVVAYARLQREDDNLALQ